MVLSTADRVRAWLGPRRLPAALVAVAALALVVRLLELGHRVAYYDEAWFGYWVLKYLDHGQWVYAPTLHGPFFARVNAVVFSLLGASDATGRLVVAVMGGLLPLSAWLFRERLRPAAVVAMAVILAVNPILLYYSRFMRKDFPLAACMLLTLGLLVRLADTGRARYLYGAAVSLGVAFGTKESVLLWMVTWLGAAALVADQLLLRARHREGSVGNTLRRAALHVRRRAIPWYPHVVGSGAVFVAVVTYFYAPRSPGEPGVGLWSALGGEFTTLPAVVGEATLGSLQKAIDHWVTGGMQDHAYLPYLVDTLETLEAGALGVLLLAVLGFVVDRYTGEGPRPLVGFNFYSGVAATVGYPLANFLPVPWSTTHAVVPFAIPAAVGAAIVYRWGRGTLAPRDPGPVPVGAAADGGSGGLGSPRTGSNVDVGTLRTVLAVGLLAALLVSAAGTAYQTSFAAPHESPRGGDGGNQIVYYAQAPADLRLGTEAIRRAAASGGDDVDVLYVGGRLEMDESAVEHRPETGAWHARMPLPWYTEMYDADVRSVRGVGAMASFEEPPPVVVTTTTLRPRVADRLGEEYAARRQPLDDIGDRTVVFFTHSSVR